MKPFCRHQPRVRTLCCGLMVLLADLPAQTGTASGEAASPTPAPAGETALEPFSFDLPKDLTGGFRMGSGQRPNMDRANIRWRNLVVDLVGYFKATYDNNISQAQNSPTWDVIFETGVDLKTFWEISADHSFSFNTNVSYIKYLRNSQYDSASNFLNIQPDSELAYQMRLGEVTARIFDRISYQVEPGQRYYYDSTSGTLASSVQYPRWDNLAGISFVWEPIKDWQTSFSSTRADTIPQDKIYENLRRTTYGHNLSVDHQLTQDVSVGIFGGWTQTDYKTVFNNDSEGFNYGYRVVKSFTPFLVGSWRHSFNDMTFSRGGFTGDTSDNDSQNYEIGLTHQPFREISHAASWSRSSDIGFASNTRNTDTYGYTISYSGLAEARVYAQYTLSKSADSGGIFAEQSTLDTITLGYDRNLTRKLSLGVMLIHTEKDSNFAIGNYKKDQLIGTLTYDF